MPTPNTFPPSIYILRGLLECEEACEYEQHACVNDCVRFKPLPRKEWAAHKDEQCPHCSQKGFDYKHGAGSRLLIEARKVLVIQSLI